MEWISVDIELPNGGTYFIAHTESGVVGELMFNGKQWFTMNNSLMFDVTHWMPLPEPPKEKDNG